jgi:hypothetical protein
VSCDALSCCIFFCRSVYDLTISGDSWRKEAFELISAEVWKPFERLDPWVLLCGTSLCFCRVLLTALQKMNIHCFRFQWFPCFAGVCVEYFIARGRFQGSPAVINYQVPCFHTAEATSMPSFHAAPPWIHRHRLLWGAPREEGRERRRWDLLSKSIGLQDKPILPRLSKNPSCTVDWWFRRCFRFSLGL